MTTEKLLPLPPAPDRVLGCYWRPNTAFLDELAAYLQGKKVLEIFAGNGYLAAQLHARGVDITATGLPSGHDAHDAGYYHSVENLHAVDAVFNLSDAHDVLLVSWPTVTNAMLAAALLWGHGRDIVFIGEYTDYEKNQLGGCATDQFFEATRVTHRFDSYRGNVFEHAVCYQLKNTALD